MTDRDLDDPDDPDKTIEQLSNGELLRRAFGCAVGEDIAGLFWSDEEYVNKYDKPRYAKLALGDHFAFWTRENSDRMAQLYRRSHLVNSDSEIEELVETALELRESCEENVYTPPEALGGRLS